MVFRPLGSFVSHRTTVKIKVSFYDPLVKYILLFIAEISAFLEKDIQQNLSGYPPQSNSNQHIWVLRQNPRDELPHSTQLAHARSGCMPLRATLHTIYSISLNRTVESTF